MQIKFLCVGKTADAALAQLIAEYQRRVGFYTPFEQIILPDVKNAKSLSQEQLKNKEGEGILKKISGSDTLVLLCERGKLVSSEEFASFLEKRMQSATRQMIFVVGGAYGFSPEVYQRANFQLSLSKMTFSHQMVRLFFCEQLYRAFTIMNNEPYHHR